jgi:RNA polymerase sigma-70 factor, ECF subfamily
MPPFPNWFDGRDAVIAFIASTGKPRLRNVATQSNGQPAVAWYMWRPQGASYVPTSIEVLTLEGEHVKQITAFASPRLFADFGLPPKLPPGR